MPAEVESMVWADHGNVGDRPWHGLGVKVDGCVSSEEAIKKSGLDWGVEKRQIFCPGKSDVELQVVPEAFAVVRMTDHKPLGVVGARYVPLQNACAFSFFDELVGSKEAIYETAGSLRGGKIIWIMSKLPGRMGWAADPIEKWLLLANAHDGSRKVVILASPVRTVCMNTLNAAYRQAEVTFEMRHTEKMKENIPDVRMALSKVTDYFSMLDGSLKFMREKKMNEDQTKLYVHKLFPMKVKMNGENGNGIGEMLEAEIGPKIQKHIDKVLELVETGKGTDIPGVKGTAYGAFNAAVEWADHLKPVRAEDHQSGRLDSIWFGTAARFKQRAFDQAIQYAQAA